MRSTVMIATALATLAAPAFGAASYPVSGRWGQSSSSTTGPVDCGKLRTIEFNGDTRTDSGGGVPAYRIRSITAESSSAHRIIDEFTTGQVRNGTVRYTLRQIDADHIEMNMQPGGALKLQRCK